LPDDLVDDFLAAIMSFPTARMFNPGASNAAGLNAV
jgi:hypothetical protein